MSKPVGGKGPEENVFGELSPQAQENLNAAREVAKQTDDMVEHSKDFWALCAQFAATQQGKGQSPSQSTAPSKPSSTKKGKKSSKSAQKPEQFIEARPLTSKRVSATLPESKGFLSRLWNAFSSAFRALISYCYPFKSSS